MFRKMTLYGIAGVAALSLTSFSASAQTYVCGPGDHWVDSCPAGTDTFDSIAEVSGSIFGIGAFADLQLHGPTTVYRGAASTVPPDHHIDTEMVSLNLWNGVTGAGSITLTAGDGVGNLSSDNVYYSPGSIIEQAGNPALADSLFDIFFKVTIDTGSGLLNLYGAKTGMAVQDIEGVPPYGKTYFSPAVSYLCDNVALIGSCTQANSYNGSYLDATSHTPVPEIDAAAGTSGIALLMGALALVGERRRRPQADSKA